MDDQNLEELFYSHASKLDKMQMKDFKNFARETKLCDSKVAETVFLKYSINKKLSYELFQYAVKEIGLRKNDTYENTVKEIVKPIEEKEKKKIKEKKKEIIKRQENLNKNTEEKKQDEKLKEVME